MRTLITNRKALSGERKIRLGREEGGGRRSVGPRTCRVVTSE
jgi:hypothetical protein